MFTTQSQNFKINTHSAATGMPRVIDSPKAIRVSKGSMPTVKRVFPVTVRNATPADIRRAGRAGQAYARKMPVPVRSQRGYEVFANQVGVDL